MIIIFPSSFPLQQELLEDQWHIRHLDGLMRNVELLLLWYTYSYV